MMRRTLLITLIFLAMIVLTACQSMGSKNETPSGSEPAAAMETSAAEPAAEEAAVQAPEAEAVEQIVPISKVKNHVNVRKHPDASSAIVGKLMPNETASVVGKAPGWFQVTLSDGTTGFVNQAWAQTTEAESATADAGPSEAAAEPAGETPAAAASVDPADMTEGVYFVKPQDGDVLEGPVVMVGMGVKGKEIRPAGEIIPGTGHHHLMIDSEAVQRGKLVASRMEIMHFGDAETEVPVRLPKGKHTLTLQFANGMHISYGEKWSKTIHITVK